MPPPPLMWATRESAAKLKTESHGKVASLVASLMLAAYPQEDTVSFSSPALHKHIARDRTLISARIAHGGRQSRALWIGFIHTATH
jgi:hypothetical protein